MKLRINKLNSLFSGLLLSILIIGFSFERAEAQGQSYQQFYEDLAPYGDWLQDPEYGYVWSPNVSRDFRPYYTNGYWAMTDYGNMWMSNYSWGWAAFHYGRWVYNDYYGWLWVPGSEWGPAWVSWRQGGGYYGWAPLGPGISINISFGNNYYVPPNYWNFIPYRNIYSRSFKRYSPRRNTVIINNTTIINNTYVDNRTRNTYVTGPRRNEVEKNTGRSVPVYQVTPRNDKAGNSRIQGRAVTVYRPNLERAEIKGRAAAPRNAKPIKTPISSDRNAVPRATSTPATPARQVTPQRQPTPAKPATPARQVTPQRQPAPAKPATPARQVTPQRQPAPAKPATPARQVTPQRQPAPAKPATPARQVTPQRQPAPAKPATPARQVTPQRQPAPAKAAKSSSSSSRSQSVTPRATAPKRAASSR